MVNGVNTQGYNAYYPTQKFQNNSTFLSTINSGPMFNAPPQKLPTQKDNVADGKDDGSIGFWKATGNFLKGAVKFVTSPFTDENGNFSLWKTIKTVAIGTAIALIPGGTAIALAAGVLLGGLGMARAGINIMTAETDAEAEAAWQSMGSSTTAVAASLYGAKQYAKATGNADATIADGVKQVFSESKTTITNAGKAVLNETPASFANRVSNFKKSAGEYLNSAKETFREYRNMTPEQRAELRQSATETVNGYKTQAKDVLRSQYERFKDLSLRELGSKIIEIAKNAKDNINAPSSNKQALILGTYGIAGRRTIRPDFYSQLSPSEQAYYNSLSEDQKEALVEAYRKAA